MTRGRKAQARMALGERGGEQLAELVPDELPESLISAELQDRLQDLAMRLQAQGMQLEQYLQMTGSDPEAFSQELRDTAVRSEEHTSELQSLMRISYAVFCLKTKKKQSLTQRHPNLHINHKTN